MKRSLVGLILTLSMAIPGCLQSEPEPESEGVATSAIETAVWLCSGQSIKYPTRAFCESSCTTRCTMRLACYDDSTGDEVPCD